MDTQKPHQDQKIQPSEPDIKTPELEPKEESRKPKSKLWIIVIVILVLAIAGVGGWLVYNQSKNSKKTTTQQQVQAGPNFQTAEVNITTTGFNPSTIKIKKGDQVMWKNTDSKPHRIFAEPYPTKTSLPELDSEALQPNTSYGFIFEQTGTYKYTDYNNPTKFLGVVIVE